MTGIATRQRILDAGSKLVHVKGYKATGIQEILESAHVPKGSFYFYFKSKDEYGLSLVQLYVEEAMTTLNLFAGDTRFSPLQNLRRYMEERMEQIRMQDFSGGCPLGNLAQELSSVNERFRAAVESGFQKIAEGIELFLAGAKEVGELPEWFDTTVQANMLLNMWEGCILRSKAQKSTAPLEAFHDMLFSKLLQ